MAGANPAMIVRVAANLDQFKRNLAEGKAQIETFTGGMAKLAASLDGSKLEQRAHNIVGAINEVGGASKLSDAEARRMLTTLDAWIDKGQRIGKEVPADILKTRDSLVRTNTELTAMPSKLTGIGSGLSSLAGAFGLTFSIGAVVGLGRELLQMGDDIVRVADRTGLLTSEVQKLSYIGGQSGNTLEELTSSIGQMQNRLASGDDSAIAALKRLNVNFDDLKAAAPYEQLEMIAEAVGKVQNPATQAQIAMDLFGKTGIAILPTLKAHFKELGDEAPVMSDKTVRALDTAGDSLAKFKAFAMVWAAEAYNYLGKVFDRSVAAIYGYVGTLYESVAGIMSAMAKIPGASKVWPSLEADIKGATESARWFKDAATAATLQSEKVAVAVRSAGPPLEVFGKAAKTAGDHTHAHAAAMAEVVSISPEMQHALDLVTTMHEHEVSALKLEEAGFKASQKASEDYIKHLPHAEVKLLTRDLSEMVPQIDTVAAHVNIVTHELQESAKASTNWGTVFKGALGELTVALASAFSGGGGILSGLKAYGTTVATDFIGGLMSAIPGIGPALAQLAGPIVDGFKKLFGSLFGTAGRDAVKDFAATFQGGFDGPGGLHESLAALGAEGERLWIKLTQGVGRNNPAQAKQVIDEITAALAAQKDKQKEVQDTAVAASEAQIAAQKSAKDAVTSLDAQIKSLSDSIAGEAPEEFMGIVEQQTRARIAALSTEREAAQQSLEQLSVSMTDSIHDVAQAIKDLPDAIKLRFDWSMPERPDGAATGGFVGGSRVLPFASGGMVPSGTDTVPAMLTPGEIVINAAQQKNVADSVSGGGVANIAEMRALKAAQHRTEQLLRDQPRAIAVAVQDAFVLAVRKR
jgi:hypothetical protein